jgi:hypothetical protein
VKYKNIVSTVCLGLALCCAQQAAQARGGIAIDFSPSARGNDFGSTDGTFGVIGVANDGSSEALDLGFDVDWGQGATRNIFISENGIISFGAKLGAFQNVPLADLVGGSTTGVIAPFYADFLSNPSADDDDLFTAGANGGSNDVFWQRGFVDINNDGDFSDESAAFRVTWNGMAGVAGSPMFTQLYLISLGANNFSMRFEYGPFEGTDIVPRNGALAGYVLGDKSSLITTDFDPGADYVFLPNGTTTPPTTTVPEPSMWALLGAALLAGGLLTLRNRQRGGGYAGVAGAVT